MRWCRTTGPATADPRPTQAGTWRRRPPTWPASPTRWAAPRCCQIGSWPRSAGPAWPLTTPRGSTASWEAGPALTPPPRGAIPRSKQGNPPRHLGLGLRPRQPGPCCIYGLEVRLAPSAWCRPGASPQVESGPPSGQSHPGRRCDNDRIAKGIARSSVKQRARQAWLQSPVRKRSASMRVNLWPGPSRRIGWPACHEEAAVADSGSRSIAPTRKQRAPSAVKALAAARSTTPPVAGTT
jgi:hypothetical protein